MQGYRVGIDVGGTKVKLGLLDGEGTILLTSAMPTPSIAAGAEPFVAALCEAMRALLAQGDITLDQLACYGVGVPGTVAWQTGVVRYCPNLFGEVQLPMADLFEQALGIRPTVVQDSWAAAYAEFMFGQKRQTPDMLCVTVGTGIGCGVILNGKVFGGALGTAGELGHVPIVYGGRPCVCGQRGCLERYVSGTAIYAQAMERFPDKLRDMPPKAESVFTLAYAGDAEALALIEECVDYLAYGLAVAIDLLAVDTVLLSGGVSAHKALLIDPLEARIKAYAYPPWAKNGRLCVRQAVLGAQAPMVGAAFLTPSHIR